MADTTLTPPLASLLPGAPPPAHSPAPEGLPSETRTLVMVLVCVLGVVVAGATAMWWWAKHRRQPVDPERAAARQAARAKAVAAATQEQRRRRRTQSLQQEHHRQQQQPQRGRSPSAAVGSSAAGGRRASGDREQAAHHDPHHYQHLAAAEDGVSLELERLHTNSDHIEMEEAGCLADADSTWRETEVVRAYTPPTSLPRAPSGDRTFMGTDMMSATAYHVLTPPDTPNVDAPLFRTTSAPTAPRRQSILSIEKPGHFDLPTSDGVLQDLNRTPSAGRAVQRRHSSNASLRYGWQNRSQIYRMKRHSSTSAPPRAPRASPQHDLKRLGLVDNVEEAPLKDTRDPKEKLLSRPSLENLMKLVPHRSPPAPPHDLSAFSAQLAGDGGGNVQVSPYVPLPPAAAQLAAEDG